MPCIGLNAASTSGCANRCRNPINPITTNQIAIIGPNQPATVAVPLDCTANRRTKNSTVTGTTHNFTNVRDWEKEVQFARIYAGFHYHHSVVQGLVLGHKVAQNVVVNYFRPVR